MLDYSDNGKVRFMAHSVVEDGEGERFDVTRPTGHSFLETEASEEEYILFVSKHGIVFLDHMI